MRKLNNAISFIIVFMACVFSVVGCSPPEDPTTPVETTITLDEAKTIIIDALKINNINGLSSDKKVGAHGIMGNRNIFSKLTSSELVVTWENNLPTFSGVVRRNLGDWTGFCLEQGDAKEYYDGNTVYYVNGQDRAKSNFESSMSASILMGLDCIYVDLLFIDDAWVSIYNSTAIKNIKDTEITLTMSVNMPNYVDYVMQKAEELNVGSEGLFGDGEYRQKNKDEGSTELVIRFDKSLNISGMTLSVNALCSDWTFEKTTIDINRYSRVFTAPEWFNINDFE